MRFKNNSDWLKFVQETQQNQNFGNILAGLRISCYKKIEEYRDRPLLVYSTGFIEPKGQNIPVSIDLSDVVSFSDLCSSIGTSSIDVLIHSPGGSAEATERIVQILRKSYDEVHFLIPHSAYSAATMLALSGNSITLHPSATLGPIDPQINGIPARSIKRGFEKAKEIIKVEGPEALSAYLPLISKYSLELLEICDDSEKLAKELAYEWITGYMFPNEKGIEAQVEEVVEYFSSYDTHKTHSRSLSFEKLKSFKLNLFESDGELSNLLWEALIMLNGFHELSDFYKIFENSYGLSFGKREQL